MNGDIEDGDFGSDSFSRDDGQRLFLTFFEGLRMSSLKEIRELLVDYNYDGFISDEKFVLLFDEI